MSKIAAKISKAFASRAHRVVEVPEWGETLHVFPLTLEQLSRINEESDPMRRLVRILMVRARKEDGTPLFDIEDAEAFLSKGVGPYGPEVMMRVCAELGAGDFPDEAAVEKN